MKLFLIIATFFLSALSAGSHDLKHLPLGDNLKSDAPRVGYIWPCHIEANASGAFKDGPWLNADGTTYDRTKKPMVSGNVNWPHSFKIALEGDNRIFITNDWVECGHNSNRAIQ